MSALATLDISAQGNKDHRIDLLDETKGGLYEHWHLADNFLPDHKVDRYLKPLTRKEK